MQKILVAAIAIVVLAAGGYYAYKSMDTDMSTNENSGATSTPQQDIVQAQEVSIGTGALAEPGATVSVLYVGQLQDGTVFDSSAAHNNEPYTFVLGGEGANSPIQGFHIGINGMREGGERLMAIPGALAYGARELKDATGKVIIPANATLIFDVKLVKVVPPAAQ